MCSKEHVYILFSQHAQTVDPCLPLETLTIAITVITINNPVLTNPNAYYTK